MSPRINIEIHKVIEMCASNDVAIEINGDSEKLDLDWKYIEYTQNKGCKFTIDVDLHFSNDCNNVFNSLCIVNRGRLELQNYLNSKRYQDVLLFFKKVINNSICYDYK